MTRRAAKSTRARRRPAARGAAARGASVPGAAAPGAARHPLPRDAVSLDLDGAAMRALTDRCTRFAIRHIETLPRQPSWDTEGAIGLARSFREPAPEKGTPIDGLLRRLGAAVPKSFNTAGPGYMAYIPGGGIYPAALGDYLALSVNRFMNVWNAGPALAEIEAAAIDWLRALVGFPEGSRGILTTGGSMSNFIAVLAARRERLGEDFLDGVLYASRQTHHSVAKAAMLAGFAERNLRDLPVDERLRLRPEALEEAVRADRARGLRPFFAVANAGTTNTGAIDPAPAVADICARHGLWLHVDAAYGGFFRLAPGGAALLPGLERADSLVLDPHKGLFLPYGTGCLLVRDPGTLKRAFQMRGGYLQDLAHVEDAVSFADLSPELSREFRGLRLWLPLKLFGVAAFRDNLREKLALARWAWEELRATPGFECLDEPQLSIVPFRYAPRRGDPEEFNRRLLQRVNDYRRVYLSSTTLDGRFVLRICVLSFRTHGRQVATAVEDLRRAARELSDGPR